MVHPAVKKVADSSSLVVSLPPQASAEEVARVCDAVSKIDDAAKRRCVDAYETVLRKLSASDPDAVARVTQRMIAMGDSSEKTAELFKRSSYESRMETLEGSIVDAKRLVAMKSAEAIDAVRKAENAIAELNALVGGHDERLEKKKSELQPLSSAARKTFSLKEAPAVLTPPVVERVREQPTHVLSRDALGCGEVGDWKQAVAGARKPGSCANLLGGTEVELVEVSLLQGMVRVRLLGQKRSVWLAIDAVRQLK